MGSGIGSHGRRSLWERDEKQGASHLTSHRSSVEGASDRKGNKLSLPFASSRGVQLT